MFICSKTCSSFLLVLLFSSQAFAGDLTTNVFIKKSGLIMGDYAASEDSNQFCLEGSVELKHTKRGLALLIGGRVLSSFIHYKDYKNEFTENGCKVTLYTSWKKNLLHTSQSKSCSPKDNQSITKNITISKNKIFYHMTSNINSKLTQNKCTLVRQ